MKKSRSRSRSRNKSKKRSKRSSKKLYKLYKSTNANKKFDIWIEHPETDRIKKISFGAKGYEDYSTHKDKERRERYRTRHQNDKINDPTKSGCLSYHILWGRTTSIEKNLKYFLRKFFGFR